MPKISKKVREKTVTEGVGHCRRCQQDKKLEKFHEATNINLDTNGKMSICKDCCNALYNEYFMKYGDMKHALMYLCEDLDVRFDELSVTQTKSHIDKMVMSGKEVSSVFGIYKSKLSSTGKSGEDGNPTRFKNSIDLTTVGEQEENTNVDISTILFWGAGFTDREYIYLNDKLAEYLSAYECETPVMQEYLQQAAYESLEIRNGREKKEDVSKHLNNLNSILGSANIKPSQETGANATDQMTYGVLIKKWENEDPIPEPAEEWKDVDNIGKYIRVWLLGHLCKMMGIKNEYSKEYEEEMNSLRVDISEISLPDSESMDGE